MEYGYGTLANTSVQHLTEGGWRGEWKQTGDRKLNIPLCDDRKRLTHGIKDPVPERICAKCARILRARELEENQSAVEAEPEEFVPPGRQLVTVRRRELFVVHPYQRDLMTPPWPKRWGEFSLDKFYASLEPVTVIDAARVRGLARNLCEEHGEDCEYSSWDEAKYIVLGGQHRTQEGGNVLGPDWEFEAVELLSEVKLTDLANRWWVTEQRRTPGSRVIFDKRVHDGVPEYVDMAECLLANGFTWKRSDAARNSGRFDFTSVGSLAGLWHRDEQAARIMVEVLGKAGPIGNGGAATTRMPLVRAIYEMVRWDLHENTGTHVRWTHGYGDMGGKIRFLGSRVTYYEQAIGVAGDTTWKRVANSLAAQYNKGRTTGKVDFVLFT